MTIIVPAGFSVFSSPSIIDVTKCGAVGDGVTDDSAAIVAAIAKASVSDDTWGDSRRSRMSVVFFPATDDYYRLATEVEIPANKSIALVGAGSHGSRIVADGSYAFYRRTTAGAFHAFGAWDILFDSCGIRVEDQSRNWHTFERLFFKDCPAAGILLEDDGAGEGGIVGGLVSNCEFENCDQAIVCVGQNSDNWTVTDTQITRASRSAIEIRSSGWTLNRVRFEQIFDPDQPYVQLAGNISNVKIIGCDFRGDVGTGEPPREAILVGELATSAAGHVGSIRIFSCDFQGRNGGPIATSGESAVRLNIGVNDFHMSGCTYGDLDYVINPQHANVGDGERNYIQAISESPSNLNETSALFSRPVSRGSAGSWRVTSGESFVDDTGRIATSLLATALTAWTPGGTSAPTVLMNATGPDGVGNSAYTLTKAGSGTGYITVNPTNADGTNPVYATMWVRRPSPGISVVKLGLLPVQGVNVEVPLTSQWQKIGFWLDQFTSGAASLWIYVGATGTTETGSIECTDVTYAQGKLPR